MPIIYADSYARKPNCNAKLSMAPGLLEYTYQFLELPPQKWLSISYFNEMCVLRIYLLSPMAVRTRLGLQW